MQRLQRRRRHELPSSWRTTARCGRPTCRRSATSTGREWSGRRTDPTTRPVLLHRSRTTRSLFFHQLPQEYYLEVTHSYNVVGVLDLASGGGTAAQACLTRRIPYYVGFCLTEVHVVELEKFLVSWVMDMMCTEGHPLCRKGAGPQPQEDDRQQEGKGKFKDPSQNPKD